MQPHEFNTVVYNNLAHRRLYKVKTALLRIATPVLIRWASEPLLIHDRALVTCIDTYSMKLAQQNRAEAERVLREPHPLLRLIRRRVVEAMDVEVLILLVFVLKSMLSQT